MKTILFAFLALFSFLNSYCQGTYYVGKTEYYYNQYYSTTGKPVVKRSESNKKEFLKSQGYKSIPNGYQIDHIKPLSEGGSDEPSNMQLLTIRQHQEKTSRERTNRSTSNYLTTKPNYKSTITTNEYGEQISYTTYSRTDLHGRIIYINSNGNEFYFNENERKVYVKSSSNVANSEYKTPTKKSTEYNHNTTETILPTRLYESSPSLPSISTPSLPTSTSREIITGPRGGQYYINSNGNKTYVPR
jgi:5-methylcytosine-specific restriction endonuclease McrA